MAVEELTVVEVLDTQYGIDGIVRLDVEQVLYRPTLRVLRSLGYFIALEPVAPALLCEEQQRIVHGGGIYILGEVLIASVRALASHSTTALLAEFGQSCTLDVSQVADCDYHRVIRIEVLSIELLA